MWSDNETSEDLLGFKVHADLLIDVINDENVLPVTIGVFGDWGSGKSSILHIIKSEIDKKEHEDSLCIYFNGWTFEGYDDAKAALLKAILKELEDNKKLTDEVKDAVKEKAKKLWKSINWMTGAKMAMKNIALPAISAYFTGGVSLIPFAFQKFSEWGIDSEEKLIEKLQSEEGSEFFKSLTKEVEKNEEDKTHAVADFRKDFEDLLNETKFKKLVVIIDDLDRCTPDRIIENLEAVKLFLNVPKTAFIIGADPRIVRHAIEHKYKITNQLDDENNKIINDYLEKLIQIPYTLPKLSEPEVETYISMLVCKKEINIVEFQKIYANFQEFRKRDRYSSYGLSNFEGVLNSDDFQKVKSNIITIPTLVPLITQSLYGNPRQIKRFLNTYTLRQRLANVASLSNFNDAILAKIMILEYSEPKLFNKLFEWQSLQDGVSKEIKEIEVACKDKSIEESIKDLEKSIHNEWGRNKVIKWIQSSPSFSQIDLRDYFWISRDKISTSISALSLISPIVKSFFTEIEKDIPMTATKSLILEKFNQLLEAEKQSFFELLCSVLKKNPKTKRYHDIFICMIEENYNSSAYYYKEALKVVRQSDIEPAVALSLKTFKNHGEIGEFLSDMLKDNKAFNLNSK